MLLLTQSFFWGGDILGKIFSFLLVSYYYKLIIKKGLDGKKEYNLKNVPFNIPPPYVHPCLTGFPPFSLKTPSHFLPLLLGTPPPTYPTTPPPATMKIQGHNNGWGGVVGYVGGGVPKRGESPPPKKNSLPFIRDLQAYINLYPHPFTSYPSRSIYYLKKIF